MKLEPAGRCRIAGVVWLLVGGTLVARGYPFWTRLAGAAQWWVPAVGLAVGAAKGWFVLRRTSRRNIARIQGNPGRQPVWTVYPLALYVLIPAMIGLGVALRHFLGESMPGLVVGVYFGVGAALMASSLPYFQAANQPLPSEAPVP